MKRFWLILMMTFIGGCEIEEIEEEDDYGYYHALITIDGGKLQFREDCLICHRTAEYEDGEEERPKFTYAGTVWDLQNNIPDSGIRFLIISVDGSDTLRLTSDGYGNIYTSSILNTSRYKAIMQCGDRQKVMEYEAYHGGCNDCHRPGGRVARVLSCD